MRSFSQPQLEGLINVAKILKEKGEAGLDEVSTVIGSWAAVAMFVAIKQEEILNAKIRSDTCDWDPRNDLLKSLVPEIWQALHHHHLVEVPAA